MIIIGEHDGEFIYITKYIFTHKRIVKGYIIKEIEKELFKVYIYWDGDENKQEDILKREDFCLDYENAIIRADYLREQRIEKLKAKIKYLKSLNFDFYGIIVEPKHLNKNYILTEKQKMVLQQQKEAKLLAKAKKESKKERMKRLRQEKEEQLKKE